MSAHGHGSPKALGVFGLMAEFKSPEALIAAAGKLRDHGIQRMDAFSPFPIEGLVEALGRPRTKLPVLIFLAGIAGLCGGLALEIWTSAYDYPLNIGGRPLISLPSFIPPAFECTILLASLTAVFGMFALNGLPLPYHPVFNVKRFSEHASCDGFFLCVEATDRKYDAARLKTLFQELKAEGVYEVEE